MEGRRQIVTVHPPPAAAVPDPVLDLEVCREAPGAVLRDCVRSFPEQCDSLGSGLPPDEPRASKRRPP
jgi:hypothetical protein